MKEVVLSIIFLISDASDNSGFLNSITISRSCFCDIILTHIYFGKSITHYSGLGVYPRINREANVLLIEGIKGGNPGNLRIENPLFVYENEKSLNYSQEILDLFMLGKKE